jgi:hypothetical protein
LPAIRLTEYWFPGYTKKLTKEQSSKLINEQVTWTDTSQKKNKWPINIWENTQNQGNTIPNIIIHLTPVKMAIIHKQSHRGVD